MTSATEIPALLSHSAGLQAAVLAVDVAWARVLWVLAAAAVLTGIVTAVVRIRGVRQEARQRELEGLVAEQTATAEKLRELDDLKSQFFANVSHELRTPLTLTLGPLQDALDGRFGPL